MTCDTGFLNNASIWASLMAQMVKSLPANAGDMGSIPWLRRSPGGGNGKSTPMFLPGQRNLASYSPGGHRVRQN